MSDFFRSEFVQEGLKDIQGLQMELQKGFMRFTFLTDDEKEEQLQLLEQLLEKQYLMYLRMKLSDDPKAQSIVEDMRSSLCLLGMPPSASVEQVFSDMRETLKNLKTTLDTPDDT
jgi:hypothetical protein